MISLDFEKVDKNGTSMEVALLDPQGVKWILNFPRSNSTKEMGCTHRQKESTIYNGAGNNLVSSKCVKR